MESWEKSWILIMEHTHIYIYIHTYIDIHIYIYTYIVCIALRTLCILYYIYMDDG